MRTDLIAAAGGLLLGLGLGNLLSRVSIEAKVRKEYEESSKSFQRAMELARQNPVTVEEPAEKELDLTSREIDLNEYTFQREVTPLEQGSSPNAYHLAVEAKATSVEMFVDGGVNDYGISYIEDEEYLEEDGRAKAQIEIVENNNEVLFFMNGMQINDWDQRLGDSIIIDFVKHAHTGVLYVRNHRTNEDYEVTREMP